MEVAGGLRGHRINEETGMLIDGDVCFSLCTGGEGEEGGDMFVCECDLNVVCAFLLWARRRGLIVI